MCAFTTRSVCKLTPFASGKEGINSIQKFAAGIHKATSRTTSGCTGMNKRQCGTHPLNAFDSIESHILPGNSQTVSMHVPLRSLQYWSTAENKWLRVRGVRQVLVGRSSRDLPLQAKVTIK